MPNSVVIAGFSVVAVLFGFLVWRTYREYYPKKRPPQDHYYAERKQKE